VDGVDVGAVVEVGVGVTRQEHADETAAALSQFEANVGIVVTEDAT